MADTRGMAPRYALVLARRLRHGGVPRRSRAHDHGRRAALDPGRPRRRRWVLGLGRAAPGELDHQRLPARVHRGHAAGRRPRGPVGRPPPVPRCADGVRGRVRAGGRRPGPRPAHRGAAGPGGRWRRPRAGRDGGRCPPVRRPGAGTGARGHRRAHVPRDGRGTVPGCRDPVDGPTRRRAGRRRPRGHARSPTCWHPPGAGSSTSTCRSASVRWCWPGPPRPDGRRRVGRAGWTCSVRGCSGSPSRPGSSR